MEDFYLIVDFQIFPTFVFFNSKSHFFQWKAMYIHQKNTNMNTKSVFYMFLRIFYKQISSRFWVKKSCFCETLYYVTPQLFWHFSKYSTIKMSSVIFWSRGFLIALPEYKTISGFVAKHWIKYYHVLSFLFVSDPLLIKMDIIDLSWSCRCLALLSATSLYTINVSRISSFNHLPRLLGFPV